MRSDVYQTITNTIIAELERGVRPWSRPWEAGRMMRPMQGNFVPYRGVNVLMLWAKALQKGFSAPVWVTFRQAVELGGHVRKGERGSLVVYASSITRTEADTDSGEALERNIPFMKGYTVFNADQIEGLPEQFYPQPDTGHDGPRDSQAERFFAATGAPIREGGAKAFYRPSDDSVQMPPFPTFRDAESYYAVLAHEVTHWTGHEKRLARDFGQKRWGDGGYAMEELVAELGAAFLCADLALRHEPRPDHAAYIDSWLTVLKGDKRAIFTAAAHAQRATDYLQSLQPVPE